MNFQKSRLTRPRGLVMAAAAVCLGATFASAADSVVVFNEINYHPAAATGTEWIELRNLMGVNVDISGWRLADGTDYTFPKGTVIAGHGFLLVAADPSNATLAGKGALGPLKGALSNSGETLQLRNNSDRIMDEVTYSDSGDWPAGPDGGGPTLAKRDQGSADSQASNWTASPEQGGTPGAANFPIQGQVPVTSTLVSLDAVWKYRADAAAPEADWNTTAFNDTAWPTGQAALYSGTATVSGAGEGLLAWWPLDETSGTVAANAVSGGQAGTLVNGPVWTADPIRGRVLSLQGASDYVSTGSSLIPVMTLTNNFTWAFWAKSNEGSGSNVVLGNRYNPSGADWNPREFLKFTPSAFEYHSNAIGQNVDYGDFPTASWVHHAVVKSGATLTYYRNGTASGSATINQGTNNPQPFYMGGDKTAENWSGSLDDVALWTRALPASSVAGLASGTFTPLSAPTDPNGGGSLKTKIDGGIPTHYFRKSFTFTGAPALTTLTLQHLTDDGAVFYLNGTEIYRFNMPAGAVSHTTVASPAVGNASLSADITVPGTLLRSGVNVLAVEVHQDSPASPDMVFAASLESVEQPPSANTPLASVVLNEISAATDPDFRVELTNISSLPVDITGWVLKSSAGKAYTFPATTIQAGGFVTVNAATLGFTPLSGDKLYLLTAADGTFSDARAVTNKLRGRLNGRWLYPNAPTFGAANTFSLTTDVVINEIMYNPRPLEAQTDPPLPFRNSDEQWVELYNRGAAAVNLSGWAFSQGITFVFPEGTTLPPGGYLIVARDAASMATKHPGITIAGQFTGSLSRSGELLRLDDAAGNPANEVTYSDDGRWPGTADGGGSSLELRDPRSDNNSAGSWSASNETARRVWQTYTYTALATSGQNDPTQYNEFVFGLLDAGDILLDDISVIEDPAGTARELIQNGSFTTGTTAWRFLGTHRHVEVIDDPDSPGNKVLHLHASGATEHMHNHAETTLKSGASYVTIDSARNYKITFRAKWLSGSNALNTRLYFNRAAAVTKLTAQPDGGTPGAVNSTFTANAGPVMNQLTHSPAVPAAGAPATVTVNAADPDGINGLTLFYSVNGGAFVSTPMSLVNGGKFSGTVPAQAAGAKVQFYVSAKDNAGAVALEPSDGPDSRAMIPWQDGQANLDYGPVQPNNFRIVMTQADTDFMHTPTQVMSDDKLGCTVIYNESEIYYGCGVRLKGSERGRPKDVRVGFNVSFPDEHLFLGAHGTVSIDRSGSGDEFSQKEIMVKHAAARAGGIPSMNDDLIRVIAPKSAHTGSAMLLKSRFDKEWLDNQFDNGSDGRMFEFEMIYYPTTTTGGVEGLKLPDPDDVRGVDARTLGGLGKELYRWHWLIDTNRDADDYSGIISMLQTFTKTGTAYNTELPQKVDVDEWLRSFAIQTLFGIGDSYSSGSQHNLLVYFRPDDGKAMYFPWDMDFTFNLATSAGVLNNTDLNKMIAASPAYFRSYYGQLEELCGTVFNSAYMSPWAQHYSQFLPSENLSGYIPYITSRRASVLSAINTAVPPVAFAITTPAGGSTPDNSAVIKGTGWVDVDEIRLSATGQSLAITWTSKNSWSVTVPVQPGANTISLSAYDREGLLIGTSTVAVTGTGTSVPASASNLAVSELMYHPAPSSAAEITAGFADEEQFEFIELVNTSATLTVDLTGAAFTDGIAVTLPATTVPPGGRIVIPRNPAAFAFRYGAGISTGAGFGTSTSPALSNSGETLLLKAADGQTISQFTFSDTAPWPEDADGAGYSLTAIRPGKTDPAAAASWRTSAAPDGTPGKDDRIPLGTWLAGFGLTDVNSDSDGDGLTALIEYAAGYSPVAANAGAPVSIQTVTQNDAVFPVVSFVQKIGSDDADLTAEVSTELTTWSASQPDRLQYLGRKNNGDGTETVRFQSATAITPAGSRQFLRYRAAMVP